MLIGRYEVLGEVGRGGMGVVLRGRSPDGREVAIKVLAPGKHETYARFQRERRLLSALGESHGFVPCLDQGETPTGPFLVMPFLDGGTLRDRMRDGPMDIEETVALGVELGTAIGRAHERGIVHRDLKPENILFKGDRALVTDLGLARHFDRGMLDGSQSYGLSMPGEVRGTVGYMAPEQLQDSRGARPPADVFALAAILYECLTGEAAVGGGSMLEQFGRIESGAIVAPSRHRPEIPHWLDRVLLGSLVLEPGRRPADGHAFARLLAERGPRRSMRPLVALVAGLVVVGGLGAAVLAALHFRLGGPVASADKAEELIAKGDLDAALLEAQRAIDADPGAARAFAARGQVRFARKDDTQAKADFDKAVALDPKLALAWVRLGLHAVRAKDAKRGIPDFTRAIELEPRNAVALLGRGRMLAWEAEYAKARIDLERSIELAPDVSDAWLLRGAVKMRTGDLDGAVADTEKAIALDPKNVEAWSNKCGLAFHKQDFAGCEAAANKTLELDPNNANALATRAAIWFQKREKMDQVIADLNRAIASNPKASAPLVNRATYRAMIENDFPRAIEDAERATVVAPKDPSTWATLATMHHRSGDLPKAIEALTRYLELEPGDTVMRLHRAQGRLASGDHEGCAADATTCLEAKTPPPDAWRCRGLARVELGDRSGAIADLEKFLELAPDDPDAGSVRQRLERLR